MTCLAPRSRGPWLCLLVATTALNACGTDEPPTPAVAPLSATLTASETSAPATATSTRTLTPDDTAAFNMTAEDFVNRFGGDLVVYARVLGAMDCEPLIDEARLAYDQIDAARASRDLATADRASSYITAAETRMAELDCPPTSVP